ncbi:hypothetical protein [Streptomyces erythrochromogenes]
MAANRSGDRNPRTPEPSLSDGTITLTPLHVGDEQAHLTGEDELLVR